MPANVVGDLDDVLVQEALSMGDGGSSFTADCGSIVATVFLRLSKTVSSSCLISKNLYKVLSVSWTRRKRPVRKPGRKLSGIIN